MAESSSNADQKRKPIIAARETGPGAGRYGLPSTCGSDMHDYTKRKNPAYSFGARLTFGTMFKKDISPGPGYHVDPTITRNGRDGTPHYSILGRQKDLTTMKTPCPGAYSPEKVHPQGERHAPAYSMAMRTRYRKRDTTPSSNSYSLPTLLGNKIPDKHASAAFSMKGRSKNGGFAEDLAKTPGPGRYTILPPCVTKTRQPCYSLQGRNYMPGDPSQKPGPGAHKPETVKIQHKEAPAFSMGIRHSEYITPLIVDIVD